MPTHAVPAVIAARAVILFALHLAGAVALLLWSVRLIRTGVERAYMRHVRLALRRASNTPLAAATGGALAALMMQSSTAVAVLAVSFANSGVLLPVTGLALLLGADVGSATAAQILLAPVSDAIPLLLLLGVGLFLRSENQTLRQTGRILTGLALVLISLGMIRAATDPLRDSVFVAQAVGYLSGDLVSAFAVGALFAWAMHSSIATVLTVVTFAAQGILPALPAAAMVLGANLGGAVIPAAMAWSGPVPGRRLVAGNLMLRGGAAIAALVLLRLGVLDLGLLGGAPPRQVINLHLAFNLAVAVLGLPLAGPVMRSLGRMLSETVTAQPARVSALDTSVLDRPDLALACVTRELLQMGETVHEMLKPALALYQTWDDEVVRKIALLEDQVDQMHFEIKLYIARVQEGRPSEAQARRAMDLVVQASNLEDAGDQISTNLVGMARRMRAEGMRFSDEGWRDLGDFHDEVLQNVRLALRVLLTGDADGARQMLEEKDRIRQREQDLQMRHLERLRAGTTASIETSNLHQETVRALKQINTAFSQIAYPIAEESGDLLASRLAHAAKGR